MSKYVSDILHEIVPLVILFLPLLLLKFGETKIDFDKTALEKLTPVPPESTPLVHINTCSDQGIQLLQRRSYFHSNVSDCKPKIVPL